MENKSVFVIGVFDMLHQGHLNLLEKASFLGKLHVGVIKDAAVKRRKGNDRPIIDEKTRINFIRSIKGVYSAELVEDFEIPQYILDEYSIILIGEDQTHIKNLENIPFMKLYKLPRTEGISTSQIIEKMKQEGKWN